MSLLALAVLATALADSSARADRVCAKDETDIPDEAGCTTGPSASSICARGEGGTRPDEVGLEELRGCANELQNCACSLIGSRNCSSINAAGRIVLGEVAGRAGARYALRLDPATGDVTVLLDRAAARTVSDAATYTNDDEIGKMKIELHTDLYRLAAAVGLLDSARKLADSFGPRGALGAGESRLALDAMWGRISEGLVVCQEMFGRPDPSQPDSLAWYFRDYLVCGLRDGSALASRPVYGQWPGCSCHGGWGRMLGDSGACIMNEIRADRFAEQPIDARMPGMLSNFVKMLERRTGFKVRNIGTFGCGFERFETGTTVRNLASLPPAERALRAGHISDHARGTACDLGFITFRIDDCTEWTFKLTTALDASAPGKKSGESARPFYDALLGYLESHGKAPERYLNGSKIIARNGAGRFYRDLEKELSARPLKSPGDEGFRAADERALQLRIGAAVRNALTDSGFVVYDPTTNISHRDHFHFEIPASDEDYATMTAAGQDGDALRAREDVANHYIWRAAGIVEQPAQ